jgi:hypothetical protein
VTAENRLTRGKTCPSATLSTTNPTRTGPGSKPNLRGKRPAINCLSHGEVAPIIHNLDTKWRLTASVRLRPFYPEVRNWRYPLSISGHIEFLALAGNGTRIVRVPFPNPSHYSRYDIRSRCYG